MGYVLNNNRLRIEFATPKKDYSGSRFDWMGMIKEVTLDNKDTFHSKESLVPGEGSNGQGFYNEFGIEEPIGYTDAKIGERFPKIGVGLLEKDSEEPYNFFYNYDIKPFQVDVKEDKNSISFISTHDKVRGYAVKYTKTISLEENNMIVQYDLENIGEKSIETTEYCHNFVAINNNPIGPDYELEFSYPVILENKIGDFEVNNNKIVWSKPLKEVMYCKLKDFKKEEGQYFQLIHKPSKVGFRETSYFNLERVAVWGMPHVVSPEAFVKISINPGEKQSWKRVYTFFN